MYQTGLVGKECIFLRVQELHLEVRGVGGTR